MWISSHNLIALTYFKASNNFREAAGNVEKKVKLPQM